MSAIIEVRVPDIGDFSDVPVVEVLVSAGDTVAEGDTLVVLESDKSTLEVPAETAGRISNVAVSVDDVISEGSLIMSMEVDEDSAATNATESELLPDAIQSISTSGASTEGSGSSRESAAGTDNSSSQHQSALVNQSSSLTDATEANATEANATASNATEQQPGPHRQNVVYASPSIRRYARQLGATIGDIEGTGSKQRITREDVERYVKGRLTGDNERGATGIHALTGLPDWPQIDYKKFGPIERTPLSRIAKISGPALTRNAMVIPHVTHFDKADITELEAFRQQLNAEAATADAKITLLTFAVKAVVAALKTYPVFNSSLDAEELIVKQYWNIGIAADTPDGLVVPVVKAGDQKGFREIANEMATLAASARKGKLKPADMQGATFSISSLGGIGGTNFTPIINAPEVAILGLPRSEMQPVWNGDEFKPRLVQPLSLSFDHRVIDGVAAARFLAHIAASLNDLRRINM